MTKPDEPNSSAPKTAVHTAGCLLPKSQYPAITLGHGGGGKLTQDLLNDLFLPAFENEMLATMADSAVIEQQQGRLAFSTDSYVVQPLLFPGGSIGDLAIHGTLNDLAMSGAMPICMSVAFILEEGLPWDLLRRIVSDAARAAREAGVKVVTGDTKVVERGHGDGCYLNTSGIGLIPDGTTLHPTNAQVGDVVLISGFVGDHGMAIMSAREGLEFESTIQSDTAALHKMVQRMLDICPQIRVLRDPTRGGLAASLNELAIASGHGIELDETAIPIRDNVAAACEILGLDPLQVANEGKLVCIVDARYSDAVVAAMKHTKEGANAKVIGEVVADHPRVVVTRTAIGGKRVLAMPVGQQLPRIC